MAKPSITKDDVRQAVELLKEQGIEKPASPQIRALLGCGSYTTIQKYLAQLAEDARPPMAKVEHGFTESELANLVKAVWPIVKSKVGDQTEQISQDAEAKIAAANESLKVVLEKADEQLIEIEKLRTDFDNAKTEIAALRQDNERMLIASQGLMTEKAELQGQLIQIAQERDRLIEQNLVLNRQCAAIAKQAAAFAADAKAVREYAINVNKKNMDQDDVLTHDAQPSSEGELGAVLKTVESPLHDPVFQSVEAEERDEVSWRAEKESSEDGAKHTQSVVMEGEAQDIQTVASEEEMQPAQSTKL